MWMKTANILTPIREQFFFSPPPKRRSSTAIITITSLPTDDIADYICPNNIFYPSKVSWWTFCDTHCPLQGGCFRAPVFSSWRECRVSPFHARFCVIHWRVLTGIFVQKYYPLLVKEMSECLWSKDYTDPTRKGKRMTVVSTFTY